MHKKSVESPLSIPRAEALALPIAVEQTMLEPTLICIYNYITHTKSLNDSGRKVGAYIPKWTSTIAKFKTAID